MEGGGIHIIFYFMYFQILSVRMRTSVGPVQIFNNLGSEQDSLMSGELASVFYDLSGCDSELKIILYFCFRTNWDEPNDFIFYYFI